MLKKNTVYLVLAVSMLLLLLSACKNQPAEPTPELTHTEGTEQTVASAQPELPTVSPDGEPTFDPALAGRWSVVSKATENHGDISFDMPMYPYFLPDGTYLLPINDQLLYTDYIELGTEPLRATTENGILHLVDRGYQLELSAGTVTQEEVDLWAQVDISYELSDIKESINASYRDKEWYEMYDNDLLTLHITGTQADAEDPDRVYAIDTTYVYEKAYPTYWLEYLHPALVGEWTDNIGNRWTFGYEKDAAGEYQFSFSAISAADGQTYEGDRVANWRNGEGEEGFWLYMKDGSDRRFQILSHDGNVIRAVDEFDEEFVLTKQT